MVWNILLQHLCGTPWARAPEVGTGPREQETGPRGIDPLGLVPEDLILHNYLAKGGSQWLFYAIYYIIKPLREHGKWAEHRVFTCCTDFALISRVFGAVTLYE